MKKTRVHLVSSKGKVPAGVYAEVIAKRQKHVNPTGTNGSKTSPAIDVAHTTQPPGVKPYAVTPKTGLTR